MYLNRFDNIVKEKCKQHAPQIMNNRATLFQSRAQRFSDIYNVKTPTPSFTSDIGYNSGFSQSSVPMNEIDVFNSELTQLRNELLEMTTINNTLREENRKYFSEMGSIQLSAEILSEKRNRINRARHRDANFTDENLAFIEMQNNHINIVKDRYKQVLDQKIRYQVKDELMKEKQEKILSIYTKISNRGPGNHIVDLPPQARNKGAMTEAIIEYLFVNNMIGNILSGIDENIEVNIDSLNSSDDDIFNRVLIENPRDRSADDVRIYPRAPERPARNSDNPFDDEDDRFLDEAQNLLNMTQDEGEADYFFDPFAIPDFLTPPRGTTIDSDEEGLPELEVTNVDEPGRRFSLPAAFGIDE